MSEKILAEITEATESVTATFKEGVICTTIIQEFMNIEVPTGALTAGSEVEIDTLTYTDGDTFNKMLAIVIDADNVQQFPTTFKMKTAGDTSVLLLEVPFNSAGLYIVGTVFNQSI